MTKSSVCLPLAAAAALALLMATPAHAQTTSPALKQPDEVASSGGKLRALIVMRDADSTIPNIGTRHLRYFQGWPLTDDLKIPDPPASRTFTPGPTLRARVGEKVEIVFLNQVNDKNFQYTNDGGDCDKSFTVDTDGKTIPVYPLYDRYPNCFHASSTANLHFHGTHVTPDALGDNVLMEVLPDSNPAQAAVWRKIFGDLFKMSPIPSKWSEMPPAYWDEQKKLLPEALRKTDEAQIAAGGWPQYVVGGYPNTFELTDYETLNKDGTRKFTAGQMPGTHWYHAHKHGSTALHILNGLAGVFVIEGAYDDFLKGFYGLTSYGDFEKILIFQQVNPDTNLQKATPGAGLAAGQVLVNGQRSPTVTMKRGEIQLWRIVNGTPGSAGGGAGAGIIGADFYTPAGPLITATNTFTFLQTAQDGVQLSPNNYNTQPFLKKLVPGGLVLAGGNRADVLVKAPSATAGTYPITSNNKVVMYVRVTGEQQEMVFPPAFAPAPDPAQPATQTAQAWPGLPPFMTNIVAPSYPYPHSLAFGWDAEANRTGAGRVNPPTPTPAPAKPAPLPLPPKWTIDNHQFGDKGTMVDQCMPLGDTQDWVLENHTTVAHPFHIHINPFQILKIETPNAAGAYTVYTPTDYVFQDVIAVPAGVALQTVTTPATATQAFAPGRVTIRQRFADFPGTFVLHCHILAHEDRGMMQLVRVVPKDAYPDKCQANIPHHH